MAKKTGFFKVLGRTDYIVKNYYTSQVIDGKRKPVTLTYLDFTYQK